MNNNLANRTVTHGSQTARLPNVRLLQRKCACGQHTIGGGQCESCGKKGLQRHAKSQGAPTEVPAAVHETLHSPGQPLDFSTRSLMESRFGHDFSHVRVHTDATAAESAEAVDAHAYTVDRHISFGAGKYSPATSEGQRLLAHELTHVVQQSGVSGASLSSAQAEREADQNSYRLLDHRSIGSTSRGHAGQIQCDKKDEKKEKKKKLETEVKVERTGAEPEKKGDPVKDKLGWEIGLTAPLTDELSFGAVSFLDQIKFTGEGGFLGEPLGAEKEDIKLKLAMTLAKLELSNLKNKSDALKRGKLSFGTTLSATGGPTLKFDPLDVAGSLGLSLETKGSATTANIIPSSRGKLTLGTSLSGTGSLAQSLNEEKLTQKADAKVGVAADYESKASAHPLMTLGGILGDKAKLTAGLEGTASGSFKREQAGPLTTDTTSGKLSGGASIGLTGTRKNFETFVQIKLTVGASLDHKSGQATTRTESTFLGFTTGVKF